MLEPLKTLTKAQFGTKLVNSLLQKFDGQFENQNH
jgi:hypothetical protein